MDIIGIKRDTKKFYNSTSKFISKSLNKNRNLILSCTIIINIIAVIVLSITLSDTRYTQTTGYIDAEDTIITQDGNIWVTDISSVCTIYASVGDDINVTFDNKGTDTIEDDEVIAISKLED